MPNTLADLNSALTQVLASPRARYDAGRSRQDSFPLTAHAELVTTAERSDPLAVLAQQDKSRLAELVPLRYGRMSRTPFTFLRGAGQRSRYGAQK